VAEVARLMLDAGLIVMAAFISPFRQEREMARRLIGEDNFVEVYKAITRARKRVLSLVVRFVRFLDCAIHSSKLFVC
jgi:hypothetical protein